MRISKKSIHVRLLFGLAILIAAGCSKDEDISAPTQTPDWTDSVIDFQESQYQLYSDLTATMDSVSAMDSIKAVFLGDPSVKSIEESDQGIFVLYENNILGGFFLDPEDNPEVDSLLMAGMENEAPIPEDMIRRRKPSRKRTAFINPSFFEREKYANWLLPYYDEYFTRAGYDEPERYFNDEASVEKFTFL
jgi:hypothetical protein